jgi:hypothetical protein
MKLGTIVNRVQVREDGSVLVFDESPPLIDVEYVPTGSREAVRAWAEKSDKIAQGLSYTASMTLDGDGARGFFEALERELPPEPPLLTATFVRPVLRVVRRRDRVRSRLSSASSTVTGRVVGGGIDAGVLELTFEGATNVPRRRAARGLGRRR